MKVSIILAAGEGTRMKSKKPKVLHEILGKPMIDYVVDACKNSDIEKCIVVVGKHRDEIESTVSGDFLEFVEQPMDENVPYGTGFAVSRTLDLLGDDDEVVILNADTPLISAKTIDGMMKYHSCTKSAATILTAELKDPKGYGRIVRSEDANIKRIVEEKDASEKEKFIREINSGIYAFNSKFLKSAIGKLDRNNATGELYLTDVIGILVDEGQVVDSYKLKDTNEILGVNSRSQLHVCTEIMRDKLNKEYMDAGVTIMDSKNTFIEIGAVIERDVVIYPGTIIDKDSKIGEGTVIYSSRIVASEIGKDVLIDNCVIENSKVSDETTIGPYAHLRPNSNVGKGCKIGNFVEIKNSNIGDGSKMSHLAYVGDADVGSGVNIGCGVVFVNYDGKNKFRTSVGDNAFVGSNCNLVAPLKISDNAYLAAGSTITEDVYDGQLSIERAIQKNIDHWVEKKGLKK